MTSPIRLEPADEWNERLLRNVHPPDWVNPTPQGRYNLVVIGAGTGGLITALIASSLGAKVALVERHLMGGDCLNVGCVPSKALIRGAQILHEAREARRLGMPVSETDLGDFGAVMRRMREIRARISDEDSAERYSKEFGVDVFLGDARFVGEGQVEVAGQILETGKSVIATGARAIAPPIEGLAEAGYLDNETVFDLTERPRRLAVIGAGPIGCELAQAFRRLGSEVHLLERMDQILTREDPDAAAIVQDVFDREGIEMIFECNIDRVERRDDERVIQLTCPALGSRELVVDQILVGAGRAPNVEGLGLESVGVEFDVRSGVKVDDSLRTTNPRIWAVGDVCMQWKFTHAADAAAKIVVQNALFAVGPFGRRKLSDLLMPWCTYTEPEIAHVGMYAHDARKKGLAIDTYRVPIADANRAVTDGQEEGLVKVHVKKGSDEIVGATIVAAHAGDLVTQFTMAIRHGIGLGAFTDIIYPYPTQGEAIKRAAGAYTRSRLTPTIKRLFERWLSWQR
ncbi:MAG TPA: mercuric reductase [Deltaproteobacteria bacterium]|nr:mercuric reductase [Deltaproteobacteria bacterium]